MDGIIAQILGLSGSAADLSSLHQTLQQSRIQEHLDSIPAALQTLEPAQHSLGMLWLLEVQSRGLDATGSQQFVDTACAFLMQCQAEQIRLAPELCKHRIARLCRKLKSQVVALRTPQVAILPMQSAIRCLQDSPAVLTPMHADFFQLCLLAKNYKAAAPLLAEDILDVDPARTSCTPTDLYLYSYYGSMLCMGRKEWGQALTLLMLSLGAPAAVSNAIVLAAYKKYVLATLIHKGTAPTLPKYVSQVVRSMTDTEARPYNELSAAYCSHNSAKTHRVVELHQAVFNADGNMGLVKRVLATLTARHVQRLTTTFLTLSLADIAAHIGAASVQAVELLILRMVDEGSIAASISDTDGGMVHFLADKDECRTAEMTRKLQSCMAQCMALSEHVTAAHEAMATDREYLRKVTGKERLLRYDTAAEEAAGLGSSGMFHAP
ncbi:hypothetical protein QJQ45_024253 [Haematococcus lacustris]|nr:hypothetical protein QJQ45_024253 [Haematococcus lacustris]